LIDYNLLRTDAFLKDQSRPFRPRFIRDTDSRLHYGKSSFNPFSQDLTGARPWKGNEFNPAIPFRSTSCKTLWRYLMRRCRHLQHRNNSLIPAHRSAGNGDDMILQHGRIALN